MNTDLADRDRTPDRNVALPMERRITPQKKGYTDERDGSARAVPDGAGRISEPGA